MQVVPPRLALVLGHTYATNSATALLATGAPPTAAWSPAVFPSACRSCCCYCPCRASGVGPRSRAPHCSDCFYATVPAAPPVDGPQSQLLGSVSKLALIGRLLFTLWAAAGSALVEPARYSAHKTVLLKILQMDHSVHYKKNLPV